MEAKFVCNLKKYRVAQELTQEQLAGEISRPAFTVRG